MIAAPLLSHARPIGALVVRARRRPALRDGRAAGLSAIASHIVGVIESARLIEMIGQATRTAVCTRRRPKGRRPARRTRAARDRRCAGRRDRAAASSGRRFRAACCGSTWLGTSPDAERARVRDAMQKTRNDLMRLQAAIASELGEEEALVFGSHLLFLADPLLQERVEQGIGSGLSAARRGRRRARRDRATSCSASATRTSRSGSRTSRTCAAASSSHLLGGERRRAPRHRSSWSAAHDAIAGGGAARPRSARHRERARRLDLARGAARARARRSGRDRRRRAAASTRAGESLVVDGDRGVVILDPSARDARDATARSSRRASARAPSSRCTAIGRR